MREHWSWLVPVIAGAILTVQASGTAEAADESGAFVVRGVGGIGCAQFVRERREVTSIYSAWLNWLDGYLSAVNQLTPETFDVTPFGSPELLSAIVEENCVGAPKRQLFAVVTKLKDRLLEHRLPRKSERVTIAGSNGINYDLYVETLRRVQWALQKAGLYAGRIDGVYGPNTRGALQQFQTNVGLSPTGDPDELTLLMLLLADPGSS